MERLRRYRQVLFTFVLLALAAVAEASPKLAVPPLGYQITQVQAVPGTAHTYDVLARVGIVNLGDPASAVTAQLTSSSPNIVVVDGDVSFGNVPHTSPWRPVMSRDTFSLRVTFPAKGSRALLEFLLTFPRSLKWQIDCGNCGDANRPPIANAGPDQTVYATQTVTLDGSASSDPDGQALSYAWSFLSRPAGSTSTINGPSSVKPTFIPDRDGSYVVQLVVNDGQLSSAPDTVEISTLNSAPVARAGADRSVSVGQTVQLDGSASSDVDGDPLTYAWSIANAPAGSTAAIVNPDEVMASFTPDRSGEYLVELIVDDGTVSSAPDSLVISTAAQNTPPVANAGDDQSAKVGDTAVLDGSASSDADGDALNYAWTLNSRPTESAANLSNADTPSPSLAIDKPGTYVAQLIVNDGQDSSAPDTVAVSTINSAPVARIAAPASVKWNTTVDVDGTTSSDADGDGLVFSWAILSKPSDSNATLSDPNVLQPSFTADRPGVYVVQLIVNDGQVDSEPKSASITATNEAPVAVDDVATTEAGSTVAIDVLANDSDADGDSLSIFSVTATAHGTVDIDGDVLRYTPAPGFTGNDAFSYTVTDGAADDTANVSITVVTANTAPTAVLQILPSVVNVGSGVTLSFGNSSDPDAGDSIAGFQVTLRSAPAGSAGGAATGTRFTANVPQSTNALSLSFVPDVSGIYAFELVAIDSRGASSAPVNATLTANPVAPANNAPTAVLTITPDAVELAAPTPVVTLDFAKSSDPDPGDSIAAYVITLVSAPAGSAGGAAGGQVFAVGTPLETASSNIAFVPDVAGTYSFLLLVRDMHGLASQAVSATLVATAPPPASVANISIDKVTVFLPGIGQSVALQAQAFDDAGQPVAATFTWSSSDPVRIAVNTAGVVTALDLGSAEIVAEAGGVRSAPSLAYSAELVPGTLLVADGQVVSIGNAIGVDPTHPVEPGVQYEVRLSGVSSPPAAGTVVWGGGDTVIAGKVVSAYMDGAEVVAILELRPLYELLDRYRIDWSIDLSEHEVRLDQPQLEPLTVVGLESATAGMPAARQLAAAAVDVSCDGTFNPNFLSTSIQLGFTNQLKWNVQDHKEDASLPPSFSKHAIEGTASLDGTVKLEFAPGFSAGGECLVEVPVKLPVGGPISIFVSPQVRFGLGAAIDAKFKAMGGLAELKGSVSVTAAVGWLCPGQGAPCHALNTLKGNNKFEPKLNLPSINQMEIEVSAQPFLQVALDATAFLGLLSGEIVKARIGPEQSGNFRFESDQAEDRGYSSSYEMKLLAAIQPGADLVAAIKKVIDDDAVGVNFQLGIEPIKLASSPKGSFTADKTNIAFGDKITFNVKLNPVDYILIGYNVADVALYRKIEGAQAFEYFKSFPFTQSNQSDFTYVWEPTGEDLGKQEFAAFVRTNTGYFPVPDLEVNDNTVLEINVRCSPGGGGGAAPSLQKAGSAQLNDTNTCSPRWVGTSSGIQNNIQSYDANMTWEWDPTFQGSPGQVVYRATGTVTMRYFVYEDLGCSVSPTTFSFVPGNPDDSNVLLIDYGQTPVPYGGDGGLRRTITISCPNSPSFDIPATIPFFGGVGDLEENNTVMRGNVQTPNASSIWYFTQQ